MSDWITSALEQSLSLSWLAVLLLAACGIGSLLFRSLQINEEAPLARLLWNVASGLIIGALAILVLGHAQLLHAPLINLVTLLAAILGCVELSASIREAIAGGPRADSDPEAPPSYLSRTFWLLGGIGLVGALLGALVPPLAAPATIERLGIASQALHYHRTTIASGASFGLLDALNLWQLALTGPESASLSAWLFGLLTALATVLVAGPLLGASWCWFAGGLVLLSPYLEAEMVLPLGSSAAGFWLLMGLFAWNRAKVQEDPRVWLGLAGLQFGAALATDVSSIWFLLALVAALAARRELRSADDEPLGARIAILALVALLSAAPWFAPNWIVAGFESPLRPARVEAPLLDQFGPLVAMLLPGALLARKLRGLGTLFAIAGCYGLLAIGFGAPLANVAPLLAIAATWGLAEVRRMPVAPRRVSLAAIGLVALICAGFPLVHSRETVRVAVGLESRDAYLHRAEPSYHATVIVRMLAGDRARVLSETDRGLYFPGEFISLEQSPALATKDPHWTHRLRAAGVTHLLLAEPVASESSSRLATLVDGELESYGCPTASMLVELADYEALDERGIVWRYRLVALR